MHRYLLHNDQVLDSHEKCLSPGQIGLLAGWGVFSTLRVIDGVLFAFERHWERMRRDAALMRVPFPAGPRYMEQGLRALIEANRAQNSTLRVVVARNRGGMWEGPEIARDFDLIAFTTDLKNWGTGARLGLVEQARHAANVFAGTKVLSWAQNLTWNEQAASRGLDEVVLLNERGEVSECTSANIFAAEAGRVWTPPIASGCLPGVTRALLLEEVRAQGIEVREGTLFPADLEKADEVFITSSTRELLPVAHVEGLNIRRRHDASKMLQAAFTTFMREYAATRLAGQGAA